MLLRVLAHMPLRVLAHRKSGTSGGGASMEPGQWLDVSERGQFLLEFEFLSRLTHPGLDRVGPTHVAETACVYTQSPRHLKEMARQFPWVHFYAFQHQTCHEDMEYDPNQPEIQSEAKTERNQTTTSMALTREWAVALSRIKEDFGTPRLVMICHGESSVRQLALHCLLRADFSLLDVCGAIPREYLAGDIVLPIGLSPRKVFACLVAYQSCQSQVYDSELYVEELCESFFLPTPLH